MTLSDCNNPILPLSRLPSGSFETVFVADDGEFIREAHVHNLQRALSNGWVSILREGAQLRQPVTSGFLGLTVDPALRLSDLFAEVVFEPRRYYIPEGDTLTNERIREDLLITGFKRPRRYPAVRFFVTPLADYPTGLKSPLNGHACNRWSHLWTDGDPSDLKRFARLLGLSEGQFVDRELWWRYDLSPAVWAVAIEKGAAEISLDDLRDLIRHRAEEQLSA
jgi:hypothetical protein